MDEQTIAEPNTSKPLRLPPRFVQAPIALVFDKQLLSGAICTFLRIYAMHWDRRNLPQLPAKDWLEICGIGKASFYRHLDELHTCGWLSFSSDTTGVMAFRFFPNPQSNQTDPSLTAETVVIKLINSSDKFKNIENLNNKAVSPKRPGVKKARDPLLDHPGVVLYREFMRLIPNHNQRKNISDLVSDLDLWRTVLDHWSLHGWRPTNVDGMLESYRQGGRKCCVLCNPHLRAQHRRDVTDPPSEPAEQPPIEVLRAMVAEGLRQQEFKEHQRRQAEAQGISPPGILSDRDKRGTEASGRSEG
jgi:hypothetical protein